MSQLNTNDQASLPAQGLKLNLGSGFRKKLGYVNADVSSGCMPDVQIDLAREPWPWESGSVSEVRCEFSLEQFGQTNEHLKHVIRELHRVCSSEARVFIVGLHPRHDQFMLNPLCVHRLAPDFFHLLSVQANLNQIANGRSDNCVALDWGVNFAVERFKYLVTHAFQKELESGEIGEAEIRRRMTYECNVCHAYEVDLVVLK